MSYYRRKGYYDDNNVWQRGMEDDGMMDLLPNQVIFVNAFNNIDCDIPPVASWMNGMGLLPNAVNPDRRPQNVKLLPGHKCKCTLTDKRRVIFMGTRLGALAIFEMRPAGSNTNRILFSASPNLMEANLVSLHHLDNPKTLSKYILGTPGNPPTIFREIELYVKNKNPIVSQENGCFS